MKLLRTEGAFHDKETATKFIRRMGMTKSLSAEQAEFYLQAIAALELPETSSQPIGAVIMPNSCWGIRIEIEIWVTDQPGYFGPDGSHFVNQVKLNVSRFVIILPDDVSDADAEAALMGTVSLEQPSLADADTMAAESRAKAEPVLA